MAVVARKRRRRGIALPWEHRGGWARRLLAGPRWKILLLGLVVTGLGVLVFRSAEQRSRERETYIAIAEVRRAIDDFRAEVGRCPRSTVELVHPPRSRTRYLRAMPRDGWGHNLWVRCPGHDDPEHADVISAGPSGSSVKRSM